MKLGIDFGTTRVVVAAADRGNYPVVAFDAPDGTAREWFPPLVAVKGGERIYGWDAWLAQEEPGWTIVRSLKRWLESAGPETHVQIGEQVRPLLEWLGELAAALRRALVESSTLSAAPGEPLEAMLGVPANANSNQRFLTAEAFRQAGFQLLGLLNEPSAASLEFRHRQRPAKTKSGPSRILVYDLGGGTFDASLVDLDEDSHEVVASEGISTLGGDDFDGLLAELALDAANVSSEERDGLAQAEWFRLYEECRQRKEALNPNTRRIGVDLGSIRPDWPEVSLAVADFYERCRPLVEETLHAAEDLLAAHGYGANGALAGEDGQRLEALYVTGGASELPLVSRALREVFGRRVRRSAYTRSATAIGLAIQADAQAGHFLRDQFTRYFGVWREAEGGRDVVFDPLFLKGTSLPGPGEPPLVSCRRYAPAHNIGHFRYLECSSLNGGGRPTGDVAMWDDIRFPFDPALRGVDLSAVPVTRSAPGTAGEVEERYACDASGAVTVVIRTPADGYSRQYRLGRWAAREAGAEGVLVPGRRRKSTRRK